MKPHSQATPCVEVHPAVLERFEDLAVVLRPKRADAPSCWCLSYRLPSREFNELRGDERPHRLKAFCTDDSGPGVIAYVDGEPAGWCSIAPRISLERLVRSRTIPFVDDQPVWSVVCFVVRPAYRRQGLSRHLLVGAVDFAFASGATIVEGYPIDNEGTRVTSTFAFVGSVNLFESVGFTRIVKTDAKSGGRSRWLMRLQRVPSPQT